MNFRTQIVLFFFAFGMIPLLLAVMINLPLVIERTEQFYHKAHLLNLRADFRDLDQHLAAREELLKVLAKAPEPSIIYDVTDLPESQLVYMRLQYNDWINQIFPDQLDIVRISFYDSTGSLSYLLQRSAQTLKWGVIAQADSQTERLFIEKGIAMDKNRVLISPLIVQQDLAQKDVRRLLNIRLITSLKDTLNSKTRGAVMFDVDISGFAEHYQSTLWVFGDGKYLDQGVKSKDSHFAFDQFRGLKEIFSEGDLALWEGDGKQMIWVPLFQAYDQQTLWAGRYVDPSPMSGFRQALTLRVLAIMFGLIVFLAILANWVARKIDGFNKSLMNGVRQILLEHEEVQFDWKGPKELKQLGHDLSDLAHQHIKNTQRLTAHTKELEEAYRYKSEFLANMSHELRTPLNSIILLSKFLKEDQESGSQHQQQTQVIHEAGHELKHLIDNVLDLSKIEAGQVLLHSSWVDLSKMLHELEALMQPQFAEKKVNLILSIETNAVSRLFIDETMVRQIMKNFLSNAVKFTHDGEVVLALAESNDQNQVHLSVKDTGIGLSSDAHQHIFDAFRQADGSTTRKYGGTGLGLNISRRLAELLGGKIDLQSEPEKGSTFTLCLPISDTPIILETLVNTALVETAGSDVAVASKLSLVGEVLVVSQNMQPLLEHSQQLELWGLAVHGAGDIEEALETLEDTQIDLILLESTGLDWMPSELLGSFQSRALKIPVVFLLRESGIEVAENWKVLIQPEVEQIREVITPFLTSEN